ncbi:SH3 domain-containing protein [Streptomyces sp. NBC_01262]|uniref:SH3 domain-containing protein n=1 Tax=Streptomyces sp. NBC_01262 TaxID=2903803 RepID=UPI002E33AB36|nr:SH3 domain-containing protein [Streptomyces sp. NBC_01262]
MITNFKSKLMRYGLASAALAALAVPVTVVGTAAPASAAASCGTNPYDHDFTANVRQTAGVSANMRSGSSTSCGVVGWADNQDVLDYYCYTWNSSGTATWTYLHNVTDNTYGWVSDSLLPSNGTFRGSGYGCGF